MLRIARRRGGRHAGAGERRPVRGRLRVPDLEAPRGEACEILIVGGGTGGVAAALAAARAGRQVVLLEETDWIGGQLTAQGVCALDEHEHIETFGGTASYYRLRDLLRDHYRPRAGDAGGPRRLQSRQLLGQPRSRSSRASPSPRSSACCSRSSKRPADDPPAHEGVAASTERTIASRASSRWASTTRASMRFEARTVIDATELGDLLPLVGAEYVVGAETIAQTGEPHAQPLHARAALRAELHLHVRLERRADGERHVIERPENYEHFRAAQPYSLRIEVHGGEIYGEESGWLDYRLYDTMPGTKGGLWTYRRLLDARRSSPARRRTTSRSSTGPATTIASAASSSRPLDAAQRAAGRQARQPRLPALAADRGAGRRATRRGAPELRLRADVMGTADGLVEVSLHPRVAPHQGAADDRRAGGVGAPPARRRGGALRRLGRRRLVSDRHPPRRPGGRRRELPHEGRSRSRSARCARCAYATCSPAQEHRHHAHHERLLPAPPRRVEHRRGGRRAGGLRARATASRRRRCARRRICCSASSARLLDDGVPLAWPPTSA